MGDKREMDETGNGFSRLRDEAEGKLAKSLDAAPELEGRDPAEIIHELRIHQIELEMQNEELKRFQYALEESRNKYQDLYDFAPVGYFTLSRKGLIDEVNLAGAALLAIPRQKLIKMRFSHFVAPEFQNRWYLYIASVFDHEEKQNCDLTLKREDGSSFHVMLDSIRIDGPAEQQGENGVNHRLRIAVIDITERKRAEETLRESEEKFRYMTENSTDVIWHLDRNYCFDYISSADERIRGFMQHEVIGTTVWSLLKPEGIEHVKHMNAQRLSDEQNGIRTGTVRYELEQICKDGSWIWTEVNVTAHHDQNGELIGLHGVARDITERKREEEALKLLYAAIEQAAEGIIITDPAGIIQYVNPAEEAITGYNRDELIGRTPSIFKSDEHDEAFYWKIWETINAGNVWSGRFINKKKDGTEYHEDASISPVYDKSGNLINFVAAKHDVTKEIELQQQLLQAQKMEAIGTLAGGFAHDFNNLLQVILGHLDVILSVPDLPEKIQSSLNNIDRAATSGAELIKGMLLYSKKMPFKFQPVDLNTIVTSVKSLLRRTISKNIKIETLMAHDLSVIKGDSTQIEQVLINLAINARDAMPDGGGLTIETRTTVLDEEFCLSYPDLKPGRFVLLSVTDTGKGMDQETVKHIYDPFFTTKEPGKGTGLGLSVVYGILEKHGGKIICYSDPSVGTTFRIYFPAIEEVPE